MRLMLKLLRYNHFGQLARRYCKFSIASFDRDNLVVKAGEKVEYFPLVWLRDNCTCWECFHRDSFSRIIDWNKFDPNNVGVRRVQLNKLKDGVLIDWDDNHQSVFNFEWLDDRKFSNDKGNRTKRLWTGEEFAKIAKKYDYQDVMSSDKSLCNWIKDLSTHGVVLLENATEDVQANRKLAQKVAFVRKHHYGEEFEVTFKPNTTNVAYLSNKLQLHTDLPYYEYVPGVINLHCVTQAEGEGGESLLSDGFYVAEKLRKDHEDVFHILSTVKVNWLDVGEDVGREFHSEFRSPMISLDPEGNIEKIRHSVPQRDSRFTVDVKVVKPWYQALRVFTDMTNKYSAKFKLKSGQILSFDNTRIIHGREAYKDTKSSRRSVIGIYMDWDEIYSKLRVLEKTM